RADGQPRRLPLPGRRPVPQLPHLHHPGRPEGAPAHPRGAAVPGEDGRRLRPPLHGALRAGPRLPGHQNHSAGGTMRISEIFRKHIDRRIEEVIKVDLADEETVALELEEYVATDHIRGSLEQLLDHYQETIQKPNEATNLWISGFFGSGKSSFAKVLG